MEYDAGQMEAFLCSEFQSVVDCDDIEITGLSTGDNAFNLTAQIYHDTANAELTSIAWAGATWEESEFCELRELHGHHHLCTLHIGFREKQCANRYDYGGIHGDVAVEVVICFD